MPNDGLIASPAASAPRVLIAGGYGHGNLGHEGILEVMLAELRAVVPNASTTVVSGDPEATREAHGVSAVHEHD